MSKEEPIDYTPESIAIKLLTDTDLEALHSKIAFGSDNELNFEVLLTIFFEMLFNINQSPTHEIENLIDIIDRIKNKMELIRVILHVDIIEENDKESCHIKKNRYCRVILKNNPIDSNDFIFYGIENKNYHMLINGANYQFNKQLNEIYCTATIESYLVKIYFTQI